MDHRAIAELEAALDHIRQAPLDHGRLELIVRRPDFAQREVVDVAELDPTLGLVGDNWHVRPSKETPDGSPHPLRQLNIMSSRAAAAVAGDRSRWGLAGDQLYIDLHLGVENLPPGARLEIGDAVIEITEPRHAGCPKFTTRFGKEAMRFVNSPAGRALRLRGVCARVVTGGTIRTGDEVRATVHDRTPVSATS